MAMEVLACLFLAMIGTAHAQDQMTDKTADAPDHWTFSLYTANDSSYYVPGSHADRYFTHGTKFTLTHHPKWGDTLAQKLGSILPLGHNEKVDIAVGYLLAQNLYSPVNISDPAPRPKDHPYAAWLYGGMYLQRSVDDREFDHLELNLGMVGPAALGEPIQKFVHHLTNSPQPQGWNYQLHDEVGVNFIYQHKWKFTLFGDNDGDLTLQAIPQAGFTLGNINRNLNGDITMRLGCNLPTDFGPGRIDDVVSATTTGPMAGLSLYGFVRVGGRYVEHDLLLSGNNDHNSYGVAEEPWVGELQYGVALAWKRLAVTWSNRHITKEFETQTANHIIGTWLISYTQPF